MGREKDNKYRIVLISEEYFKEHSYFEEMLDSGDLKKQADRCYVFLYFKYLDNNIFIPLRTNLPDISRVGRVSYRLPSTKRPNAGLDYRKILIINDMKYIEIQEEVRLPRSQTSVLKNNYDKIEKEVFAYIDGYIKSVRKGRQYTDKKYKYSTLHNFHNELHIVLVDEVAATKQEYT